MNIKDCDEKNKGFYPKNMTKRVFDENLVKVLILKS
jgi:hypothetical protein